MSEAVIGSTLREETAEEACFRIGHLLDEGQITGKEARAQFESSVSPAVLMSEFNILSALAFRLGGYLLGDKPAVIWVVSDAKIDQHLETVKTNG